MEMQPDWALVTIMRIDEASSVGMHERMAEAFPRSLDWRLVRAFIAVMQHGTLSAAARRLGLTQPTVGRQIRELEQVTGELLFVRRGTTLEPTEAARGMLARAEDVESAVRSLGQAFARIGDDTGPRLVRVTMPTLMADHLAPQVLPAILSAAPRAQIRVDPSDKVQDLYRRSADIAVRLTDPQQPDLIAQRIGTVSFVLLAARAYLERHGTPEDPRDLLSHRIILPADDGVVSAVARRAGLDPARLDMRLTSDDLRHRHALMAAGLGIGAGHHWMERTRPALQRVLPHFIIDTRPVWLVATEDIRTSRTQRAVFDSLRETLVPLLA